MNKTELRRRVGDMSQLAGALRMEYAEGRAKGTAAIEVRNGSGLRFVVLPDRGMDIAYAELNGVPFSYIGKTGVVAPTHYDEPDFLRSFTAGLLTTCGLTYMGAGGEDQGEMLGLHGRAANIPAEDVSVFQDWVDDENYEIRITGRIRECKVFGCDMALTRTITTRMGDNAIYIHDEIENRGFQASPLMVLYHMNFGYPLLSADTVLETNCTGLRPRNPEVPLDLANAANFSDPIHGYDEEVFIRDAAGACYTALHNKATGMRVQVDFNGDQLPYLVEWKMMGEQEYVVGMEPGTYPPFGRAAARERGELLFLQPQEKRIHDLKVTATKA
ncbi:MAG: aldose 1-epimerase family protein [Clostridia bacterium]|nr:aldose 1-epimerase family protein [Clostridia bacterium]